MFFDKNLQKIWSWATCLALLPQYHAETGRFKSRKLHSYILICVLTALFVYCFVGKASFGLFTNVNLMLLKYFPFVVHLIMNVVTLNAVATGYLSKFQFLFDQLELFDVAWGKNYKVQIATIKHVLFHFISTHLYLLGIVIFDITVTYLDHELYVYKYCTSDILQYYYNYAIVFIECCILSCIGERYKVLNGALDNFDFVNHRAGERICVMYELHGIISDVANTFNSIYGWHLLQTMLQSVFKFLLIFYLTIGRTNNRSEHVAVIVIWGIYIIAQGVIVATKCEQVTNEGKKTITIAYKALHRYSNNDVLRDKLFILAQQATARCPKFTAAGFFNVDFSMLFTFVNLITTYVIVIIQFSATNNG